MAQTKRQKARERTARLMDRSFGKTQSALQLRAVNRRVEKRKSKAK